MPTKQYDSTIKNHIEEKDFAKIKRTFTEGSADITGFILQFSKDFLLLQEEEEFYLNGYAIIRKDQFEAIRCNKYDRALKSMLKKEGIINSDYGINKKIRLMSWQAIFEDLRKHDYHVIVECENLEEPVFLIGPITKVNKNSVSIQYYDPTGLLDKAPTKVNFKDITLVKFDNRYINVFKKYLRTRG
jgi:hypothetical protein